jgi:hypothetical protein
MSSGDHSSKDCTRISRDPESVDQALRVAQKLANRLGKTIAVSVPDGKEVFILPEDDRSKSIQ